VQDVLGEHQGGPESIAILGATVERRLVAFSDDLTAASINAANTQQDASLRRRTQGVVADTLSDLSVPIEERFGQLDEAIELVNPGPAQANAAQVTGREQIASAVVGKVISQGDVDENGLLIGARTLLESELLREVLSPEVRSGFANRILEVENEVQRTGIEARAEVDGLMVFADEIGLTDPDARRDFFVAFKLGGNVSDKQAASDRLVDSGVIDQELADKNTAGFINFFVPRNVYGEVTGPTIIVDTSQIGEQEPAKEAGDIPVGKAEGAPAQEEAAAAQPEVEEALAAVAPSEVSPEVPAEGKRPPQERTVFETVTGETAVTGVGPAALESLQGILGQVDIQVAEAEQLVLRENLGKVKFIIASLVPNERFPQKQIDFFIEEAGISPGILKDRKSLVASLVAFDRVLAIQEEQALRDSRDRSLPVDTQKDQAEVASKMRNIREILGVPEGLTPEDIEAISAPTKGT
ncbi:hypothetical protein LCGC14_2595800, partial [marine sediment metagenome]